MRSTGGNLIAGLDMGLAIRYRQWRTVVVDEWVTGMRPSPRHREIRLRYSLA